MPIIHKLTITTLVVLVLVTTSMLVQHRLSAEYIPVNNTASAIAQKKIYDEKLARNLEIFGETAALIHGGQLLKARETIQKIQLQAPDNPQLFVYLAQLQYKEGQIAEAINSYRTAIEKEPGYADKNTPLYIGNIINDILPEARTKLNREKKLKPNDLTVQVALENIYYLQSRVAGGCE